MYLIIGLQNAHSKPRISEKIFCANRYPEDRLFFICKENLFGNKFFDFLDIWQKLYESPNSICFIWDINCQSALNQRDQCTKTNSKGISRQKRVKLKGGDAQVECPLNE